MNKLIRLYNQNRGLVIAIIIVIALIIIVIQTLNSLIKQENEAKRHMNGVNSSTNTPSTTISQSNVSHITGQTVTNGKTSEETIKQFVKYCNEGDINSAYDMLSNDCKRILFPSLEHFKSSYIDRIFKINRMYTLENWYSSGSFNTYYIKYTEDILASGNVESNNNTSDYITVTGENKINIGSFVGSKEVNRETKQNGITVTVHKIHYYMDNTILEFKVKNQTKNTICLDTKKESDTTYLYDTNYTRYTAFLNEISEEEMQIPRNMERTISIKFDKIYNPENRVLKRS